jgi:hypothetical protein
MIKETTSCLNCVFYSSTPQEHNCKHPYFDSVLKNYTTMSFLTNESVKSIPNGCPLIDIPVVIEIKQ